MSKTSNAFSPSPTVMSSVIRATFLGASAMISAAASAQTSSPDGQIMPAPPASADSSQLEQVVVTATRRSTNVLNTPASVSSLSGEQLQDRQINSLADLNGLVPGLEFGQNETDSRITIRGIGTNNVTGGSDPGVAYHLDGVYLGTTSLAANSFFDLSRIEVLRGPQGTLFGQNATGGTVNVIPNRPSPQFAASLGLAQGEDPFQYSIDGMINGAITADHSLSGRLSFQRNYNEGYTHNLAADGPRRLDDDDSVAARGQLALEEGDSFTAHLSINYRHQNSAGQGIQLIGTPSGAPTPAEMLGGVRPNPDSFDVYANQGINKGNFLLINLDTSSKIGGGTLKTIIAADQTNSIIGQDADGTAVSYASETFDIQSREYFGEILYDINPIQNLDLIAGANLFYQKLFESDVVPIAFPTGAGPFGGPATAVLYGSPLLTSTGGAFLHATYDITPALQLFGGARFTYDRKAIDQTYNVADIASLGGASVAVGAESQAHHWTRATYELGISEKLSKHVTAYAKYATGFKGGGYQVGDFGSYVNPETDGSSEVGLKGLYFDKRLESNLSLFRMSYNNLQVQTVNELSVIYTNAAKAHVNGAELENIWHVTHAFRTELSGTFLDARFDQFTTEDPSNPTLGTQNLHGKSLPNAPRFTTSFGAYYGVPAADLGVATLGARFYWQDTEYFSEFNYPIVSQRPVGRLDLNIDFDSNDSKWRASLFARNITNEVVRSQVFVASPAIGSPALATLEPSRYVGFSIRRSF